MGAIHQLDLWPYLAVRNRRAQVFRRPSGPSRRPRKRVRLSTGRGAACAVSGRRYAYCHDTPPPILPWYLPP